MAERSISRLVQEAFAIHSISYLYFFARNYGCRELSDSTSFLSMANSNDAEESYWNDPVSEPVNIHEDVVSPEGSATEFEEQQEVSETKDSLSDLENSPGIVLSLHEPMDVDSDMPETVAESWADSMDDVGIDSSNFPSRTYDRDITTAERQDNAYEDHIPRQYTQGSRDNWRPRGVQVYHNQGSQPRASNWRGSRGRGFGNREPRDRFFRGRGFRNRDFRSWEPSYRGGRRPYRYPQRFIPRGTPAWNSQARHDDYGLTSIRGRDRRNLDQDRGYQYQRSNIEQ